jgi:hypothetical protein
VQVWEQHRPQLDALFKTHNGRGLPPGFALEPDPNRWDSFDLAAAAFVWANTDHDGSRAPRVAHRGFDGADTAIDLYLRIYGLGGGAEDVLDGQTDTLHDAFVWEAFMARDGLYSPRMWQERWGMGALWNAMGDGTIFLTFMDPAHAALLHGGVLGDSPPLVPWPEDLAAARLPRGVSLDLGADGSPARMGDGAAPASVTYWVVPRTGPDAVRSAQLAAALAAEDAQAQEAVVFATVPSRQDVTDALGSLSGPQWIKDLVIAGSQQAQISRPLPTDPNAAQVALEYVRAWHELVNGADPPGSGPITRDAVGAWLQPLSARVRALTR